MAAAQPTPKPVAVPPRASSMTTRVSHRQKLTKRQLMNSFISGRYMVELYLTTHQNIKDAFSTLGVVAALLMGVGLQLLMAPSQDKASWEEYGGTSVVLAVCSGWMVLFDLTAILLCLACLSFVSHIPEEGGLLKAFVQQYTKFFVSPILMLAISIELLVCALGALSYFLYGSAVTFLSFFLIVVLMAGLLRNATDMLDNVWHLEYALLEHPPDATTTTTTTPAATMNPLAAPQAAVSAGVVLPQAQRSAPAVVDDVAEPNAAAAPAAAADESV
jgi:hypothetical protein